MECSFSRRVAGEIVSFLADEFEEKGRAFLDDVERLQVRGLRSKRQEPEWFRLIRDRDQKFTDGSMAVRTALPAWALILTFEPNDGLSIEAFSLRKSRATIRS
jgi:hypothetical protein